jgi:photosystem II stability/assembly factor-like uncharacterized protein
MLRLLSLVAAGIGTAVLTLSCSDTPTATGSMIGGTPAQSAPAAVFTPTLTRQTSGTDQRFFAVSPVNDRVVWASAAGGIFAKTTDGGATWVSRVADVPEAATLQFRDVHAVSERVAYLLSAGEGLANRIYKTVDGGEKWERQFQAGDDEGFFYDCFDFWTPNRGITFADGKDGRFPIIRTSDGKTWRELPRPLAAQPGEAGFAASGTCITTQSGNRAWMGTGGAAKARVLATTDGGESWISYDVPILQGSGTSGVVSIDFRDPFRGILGGGDIIANTPQENVARSSDGGKTWTLTTPTPFLGAVYGLSYVPGMRLAVVATGPNGAAWSPDEGDTWSLLPGITNFWAVAFASRSAGWLVGGGGQIVKIDFTREAPPENRGQ